MRNGGTSDRARARRRCAWCLHLACVVLLAGGAVPARTEPVAADQWVAVDVGHTLEAPGGGASRGAARGCREAAYFAFGRRDDTPCTK
jgi:hypothetical protein